MSASPGSPQDRPLAALQRVQRLLATQFAVAWFADSPAPAARESAIRAFAAIRSIQKTLDPDVIRSELAGSATCRETLYINLKRQQYALVEGFVGRCGGGY